MGDWVDFPVGFYVYEIAVDGVVRYIGKGKNGRVFDHLRETRVGYGVKINQAYAGGARLQYRIVQDGMTEDEALREERRQIAIVGYEQLWNTQPDPFRMSRVRWSHPSAGKRQAKAMRKRWDDSEYRERVVAAQKARWAGSERWNNKLTKEAVVEIRTLIGKISQAAIAQRFGVSRQTVCDIVHGRCWAWV
jgi:hypothetical protein